MPDLHSVLLIAVCALVTMAVRFAPFLFFAGQETPPVIAYLGRVLPGALIGMLVIYCLKDISPLKAPFAAPELISCAVVVLLQWRGKNSLLSIVAGTVCYMLLI